MRDGEKVQNKNNRTLGFSSGNADLRQSISSQNITFPKKGKTYTLKKLDGKRKIQINKDKWLYRPPAPDGMTLEGSFSRTVVSGYSHASSRITFQKDGIFSRGNSVAVSPPTGGGTGSYKKHAGRYYLNGYTIEFIYGDGRITKSMFSYSTSKSGDIDLIYIGKYPYVP